MIAGTTTQLRVPCHNGTNGHSNRARPVPCCRQRAGAYKQLVTQRGGTHRTASLATYACIAGQSNERQNWWLVGLCRSCAHPHATALQCTACPPSIATAGTYMQLFSQKEGRWPECTRRHLILCTFLVATVID